MIVLSLCVLYVIIAYWLQLAEIYPKSWRVEHWYQPLTGMWIISYPFYLVAQIAKYSFIIPGRTLLRLNTWAKKPDKIEPIRNYTKLLLATISDSKKDANEPMKLQ